jgi:hypothetical protein
VRAELFALNYGCALKKRTFEAQRGRRRLKSKSSRTSDAEIGKLGRPDNPG